MSLCTNADEIVIGLNRHIVFVSTVTKTVTKCVEIDPNTEPKMDLFPIGPEASESPHPPANAEPISRLQNLKLSPNGKHLAVTTTGRKLLLLYEVLADALKLLSARRISRASSAIAFSSDSCKILLCDKTGDCYVYDSVDHEAPGKWIFGHLSMVLDVQFAPRQDVILTSDRDEKVRVSNYPASHEIETFCLGHTEYVSSIGLLPTDPDKVVVSVSGDRTIKLWNYRTGKKLHELAIPAPGIKGVMRQESEQVSHLAVLVHQPDESIFVYELLLSEGGFKSNLISSHSFPSKTVTDLGFCGNCLHLTTSTDGRLGLEALRFANGTYEAIETTALCSAIDPVLEKERIAEIRDVSGWFKKKYDNVSEYLERKKRRIDEKISKISILCK